jgi:hypothetical protein
VRTEADQLLIVPTFAPHPIEINRQSARQGHLRGFAPVAGCRKLPRLLFFFSGAGNRVYIQAWMSHFVIAPPLIIISKEEIDRGVSVLDEALALARFRERRYRGYGCE